MATFEQMQAAVKRETTARAVYDAVRADYRARFYPQGSGGRVGYGDRVVNDYEATKETPEAREYEAAAAELARLQREAVQS